MFLALSVALDGHYYNETGRVMSFALYSTTFFFSDNVHPIFYFVLLLLLLCILLLLFLQV